VLKGKARIIVPRRSDRSRTGIIYIPADLIKDSSFPFHPNEQVTIRIEGGRLIIEKEVCI
jgi:virulence-associated protein VagC